MMEEGEGPSAETLFNMKLEIQQLRAKVEYLGGGTDAEQLCGVLMEKEEEGRAKDRTILELQAALQVAQEEGAGLRALSQEQARSLAALTEEVETLRRAREGLVHDLSAAHARAQGLEVDKIELEGALESTQETLDATRAALARREAAVGSLEEARRQQEQALAELGRGKEEAVARLRSVKAAMEQQLGHERTRYSLLEGQLQVCRRELSEAKARLRDHGRWMEEAGARDQAHEVERGRLEARVAALAEEKERARAAADAEVAKLRSEARVQEAQWRERLVGEEERGAKAVAESRAQAAMVVEESAGRQAELEGQVAVLAKQVTELADRVLAAERAEVDIRAQAEAELQRAATWQRHVQEEATVLRREVSEQRRAVGEVARLRQENKDLKEKVQRQEAYLRRRIVKERAAATGRSTSDPDLVAAAKVTASELFVGLDNAAATVAASAIAASRSRPSTPLAASSSPRASAALTALAAVMASPARGAGHAYATPSKAPLIPTSSSSPARLLPGPTPGGSARRENKENSFPHLALPPPSSPSSAAAATPVAMAAAALHRLGLAGPVSPGPVLPAPPAAGAVFGSGGGSTPTAGAARFAQPSPARLRLMAAAQGTPPSWTPQASRR